MGTYILGIDQSTQGTKSLLFNENGSLIARADLPHKQIINNKGWVEHDPEEFYTNIIKTVKMVVEKSGIDKNKIIGVGICNQRETSLAWEKGGKPIYNAIVWHCARGKPICDSITKEGYSDLIRKRTGIQISPYFSATKLAWILENVEGARDKANRGELMYGTVDTFLIYRLTKGAVYKADYSNASRTQLFNINTLKWDEEICNIFNIPIKNLAEVIDSDGYFGETDFEGYLDNCIPIHGVIGDSNAALFSQGCLEKGMIKSTYGTGSSVMMNVGDSPVFSKHGVVSSLAWSIDGKVNYVLEGNINYTGAVITWLQENLKLIISAKETENLAKQAYRDDHSYLVPAFTGLGAPYWNSQAEAIICGMTRRTGKAEIVKDALDCIAYQITDVIKAMEEDAGLDIKELRVDGGATRNNYLMQFQSDITRIPVLVSPVKELSAMGAAYVAGIGLGFYQIETLFQDTCMKIFKPEMINASAEAKYRGWKDAVSRALL